MEMLELNNLHKTFNPGTVNEKVALNGVSLHMEAGRTLPLRPSMSAARSSATCSRTPSRARPPI